MEALRAEALNESKTVVWRDRTFVIPPADDWTLTFAHWYERDKITKALESILGPEQYEDFITASPPPRMTEAGTLINSIHSAFGLDAGEDSASAV